MTPENRTHRLDLPAPRAKARWRVLVAALAVAAVAACGAPATESSPDAAMGAAATGPERPVDETELAADTTYRFADVLPGVLDVDLTVPEAGVFSDADPSFAYLAGDSGFTTDVLALLDADDVALTRDPLHPWPPDEEPDPAEDLVVVAPDELLTALSGLPFVEVVEPIRPTTAAGVPATVVDLRVSALPSDTGTCGPGAPPCAVTLVVPGFAHFVVAGQELRFLLLDHPLGPLLVLQNLQDPRAQSILDGARFVEHVPT